MSTDLDPLLYNDEFWENAFETQETFRNEYLSEFRRGVISGNEDDLAWGRMAIYGITDKALWPILRRLINLAVAHPNAGFVESLAFFLSSDDARPRFQRLIVGWPTSDLASVAEAISTLQVQLRSRGDEDLAARVESFRQLLAATS
jgi:hypothetical protein